MILIDRAMDVGRMALERRVRLGVTGLSGAGKTVFVTALVQGLLHPERLSRLSVMADGRYRAAMLRPQPHADVPRFPFEECVAKLVGQIGLPCWPEGTRRISELRVSIRYRPVGLRAQLGERVLHLDLFDYPGEWLLDLRLLELSFDEWSAQILGEARDPALAAQAGPWLDHLDGLKPDVEAPGAETAAIEGAVRFTAYLAARRTREGRMGLLGPGRFLIPGDLEGSPLLTFFPLPPGSPTPAKGSLRALMAERYQAYRQTAVRGFHHKHFAGLDRQIVLADLAGHLDSGAARVEAAGRALDAVLSSLKVGTAGWLPRWIAPRIDRVLFAASKIDQIPSDQHEAFSALLERTLARSVRRTSFEGAKLKIGTLAALRATREVEPKSEERRYVAGRPIGAGKEVAHYPGRLSRQGHTANGFEVRRFQPPAGLDPLAGWPHLRLDACLEFLIGDWLR